METRPVVPDRKLLARLVLIREEARNMMGGGILDERNDRGLSTLPESEVCNMHACMTLHITPHHCCKNCLPQGQGSSFNRVRIIIIIFFFC